MREPAASAPAQTLHRVKRIPSQSTFDKSRTSIHAVNRIFTGLFIFILARFALAQSNPAASTIGSRVANSDCIVRGIVKTVETVDSPTPLAKSPSPWLKITVDVHETLLGRPAKDVTIFSDGVGGFGMGSTETLGTAILPRIRRRRARQPDSRHVANLYKYIDLKLALGIDPVDLDPNVPKDTTGYWVTDDLHLLHTQDECFEEIRSPGLVDATQHDHDLSPPVPSPAHPSREVAQSSILQSPTQSLAAALPMDRLPGSFAATMRRLEVLVHSFSSTDPGGSLFVSRIAADLPAG